MMEIQITMMGVAHNAPMKLASHVLVVLPILKILVMKYVEMVITMVSGNVMMGILMMEMVAVHPVK